MRGKVRGNSMRTRTSEKGPYQRMNEDTRSGRSNSG